MSKRSDHQVLPAANPENERWILGMAMVSERAAAQLISICNVEWFSSHDCKAIFKAILELFGKAAPWDFETYRLVAELLNKNSVRLHGFPDNLNALAVDYYCNGYGVKYIAHYIKTLLEPSYRKRNLIRFGSELPQIADDYDDPYSEVLARAQALLVPNVTTGEDIIERQERMARGEYVGIKTMMPEVDEILGLWRNGHFILLGADSSMGKTAFAGDLARKLAMTGVHVGFASLEMGIEEMQERWVSGHGSHRFNLDIPYMAFNTGGRVIRENMDRIKAIKRDFDKLPLNFIYARMFGIDQIRAEFVRMHSQNPQKRWFFIIDYVQLIPSKGKDVQRVSRERELAIISQTIKDTAGQLNAPILVLSQLNRSKEFRDNNRPTEFSFRDSGALYNDADKAIALFAESKSNPERELMVLKNRGGIGGTAVMVFYDPKCGRFWTSREEIEPTKQEELYDEQKNGTGKKAGSAEPVEAGDDEAAWDDPERLPF